MSSLTSAQNPEEERKVPQMTTRGRLDPCRDLSCKKHFDVLEGQTDHPNFLSTSCGGKTEAGPGKVWVARKWAGPNYPQTHTLMGALNFAVRLPLPTQSLPTRHTTICCCPNTLGWSLHILSPL